MRLDRKSEMLGMVRGAPVVTDKRIEGLDPDSPAQKLQW